MMFVIYKSDGEVIVTTQEKEAAAKKECFGRDSGRDIGNYSRRLSEDGSVAIGVVMTEC